MPPGKQCSESLFLLSTYQAFEDMFSPYCYHVVLSHTFFCVPSWLCILTGRQKELGAPEDSRGPSL